MSYSQYTTLKSVKEQLNVITQFRPLFDTPNIVPPSDWLVETLKIYTRRRVAYFSEKSRSEGIVFPILSELVNRHHHQFSLYSGASIEGDKTIGLSGECDFVLSQAEQSIELERPVFCIVEAKDNDIELGIPQCIAQLVGARIYNQKVEKYSPKTLYGAVTTGTEWNFLMLEDTQVIIDENFYYLNQLPQLLGILDGIVRVFLAE